MSTEPKPEPKTILNVADTAKLLRCHRDTVTNLIRSGKLKAAQMDRRILIKLTDVEAMLAENPA